MTKKTTIKKNLKRFVLSCLMIFAFGINSFAFTPPDEGMWLPIFVERLNYVDMEKMGLQLTAEEIYSINNSSIKDAIAGLSRGSNPRGYFCTGEIVSDQGLMFTNHHCGYSFIQQHSSIQHDYLTDGFWAMSKDEELQNEGLSASFLVRMADVTDSIIPFLSDTLTETERSTEIRKITKRLKKRESEDGKFNVTVNSFFGGNEYYLFVYVVYTDVRLVGAPPSSIGKFGGDTDNWMWPRHTGDFSIFRIYTAPDGSPAEYSKENIPLKPKHHLPISLDGIDKGEFAMIWGYPGGTERYLTSYGIKYKIDDFYPNIIDVWGKKLEIWKEDMDADKELEIQYSSKYFGISNGWKLFIGMKRGLKRLKVYDKKLSTEKKFERWVNSNSNRKEEYGDVLKSIKEGYDGLSKEVKPFLYANLALTGGAEILRFSQGFSQLQNLLEDKKENAEIIKETTDELKESSKDFYKNYSEVTDKKIFAALLKMYHDNISEKYYPSVFETIKKKFKNNFDAYAAYVYNKSVFTTPEKLNTFLDNPKLKTLEKDPVYVAMNSFNEVFDSLMSGYRSNILNIRAGDRDFIAGLREMEPNKVFYPDANSTMRLTYGTVQDYFAADAVHYDFVTTLAGVMEKEDPDDDEFIVDQKLKELFEKKDFGPYGQDGKMITCFLTTNDITGGNSGSPVMNGNGELIGIAFDGNWEAMSGDIAFEPNLQRCINVDIRYVLFVIDKIAGAKNLINELTIAVKKPKPVVEEVSIEITETEAVEK